MTDHDVQSRRIGDVVCYAGDNLRYRSRSGFWRIEQLPNAEGVALLVETWPGYGGVLGAPVAVRAPLADFHLVDI
ncbi:hypothetical protein LRS10_21970 [Phenylobacterium sp. J426]|uniref:hypothetical protein n=1 Tax=Phenylobacterium sp. J426 TaxID=2898439 RepID=UPI002150F86D|nr:hypothetical protein [Phenylobacterium sp. J426]MCR5876579.1 hypothetical protein [Phenylobacterium sp. J426]